MNKTKFLQTDSRWDGLGYPKKPWYIRNCGCGEVAIANIIIEIAKYKSYTPATIQPYCKQFAAPNGDGTYFAGIPKMMKHYGLTEVKEHPDMKSLWKELEKGDRVAIYLMGSRPGGSKKVHWTSGGHFVCSVDYKVKNGKHYVYVKDSYSNSKLRNGFISYEENMRNDVVRVWSGKLTDRAKDEPKKKKLTNGEKISEKGYDFAWHTKKGIKNAKYPEGHAKKAYREALDKYFGKKRRWQKSARLGASCDVFVATCIRAAGIDKNAPRGLGRSYFDKSSKFKRVKVTYKTIKDGDIISIAWKSGSPHWAMAYHGKVLEASLNGWYPKVTNTLKSRLSKSGKQSVVVYRAK